MHGGLLYSRRPLLAKPSAIVPAPSSTAVEGSGTAVAYSCETWPALKA
jgi:hypothetical protein